MREALSCMKEIKLCCDFESWYVNLRVCYCFEHCTDANENFNCMNSIFVSVKDQIIASIYVYVCLKRTKKTPVFTFTVIIIKQQNQRFFMKNGGIT